jgi:uncharacterized protein (TIGR00661 family)
MRAMSVLPHLAKRHELLILAGGDAYHVLWPAYSVARIPTLKYYYNRRGRFSNYLNVKRNISMVLDLFLKGPAFQMVEERLAEFKPDVVVTDSEAFTHRVAAKLRIPRITFDHFGVLVYCRPAMSASDRAICAGNALVYRMLFGTPDRVVVSSFFDAPVIREGVRVVGPAIRQEVRNMKPTRGQHLLAYINRGEHEFTPQIERALTSLDCPVRVYGTPRRGLQGNLQFKPLANLPFIEDLASSRAVFCTTGNQLLGEVTYFGKPVLGMPLACLEQRLNAMQLEARGVGMQVKRGRVTADVLRSFLAREGEFAENAKRYCARDGELEALQAIEQFSEELTCGPAGQAVSPDGNPPAGTAGRSVPDSAAGESRTRSRP